MTGDNKKKILIVEDDISQASAYQIKFGKDGFSVILATDGEQAIVHLNEDPVDAVVLDLITPRHERIRRAAGHTQEPQVVEGPRHNPLQSGPAAGYRQR